MLIFSFSDGQRKYDGFHSKFREAFPFTTKSCRNVLDNFAVSLCLSAWKTRGWLNGFLLNFTHNTFTGIYTHIPILVKIGQQCALCMKTYMHFCTQKWLGWEFCHSQWAMIITDTRSRGVTLCVYFIAFWSCVLLRSWMWSIFIWGILCFFVIISVSRWSLLVLHVRMLPWQPRTTGR